jgi:PKD repeat protein
MCDKNGREFPMKRSSPIVILTMLSCLLLCIVLPCPVQAGLLPAYNNIYVHVANDAGTKYNTYQNNTYWINFAGAGRGLNAHHITVDPVAAPYGQATTTTNQSGVFYIKDTGGTGFDNDVILMISANGTIPDNFRIHIRTSGYNWTPDPGNEVKPTMSQINYVNGAVDETFTKADLIYGPQTWKPSGETTPFPIYEGQDMTDSLNTFQIMFVDAYAGDLGLNSGLSGLTDTGALKVEYTIENMPGSVAFNSYAWCRHSNIGEFIIGWTNNLFGGHNGDSGYNVLRGAVANPVALPGQTNAPADPDHDGLYEDLSGNGAATYTDVLLFFKNLEWIQVNEPVSAFDYSGNGAVTYTDIRLLFKEV